MNNPFYISGIIPEPYFCDREKETKTIVDTLKNQGDILLTSARRMGKTQLIRHIFEQESIKEEYYTFYIDIYATSDLSEMVFLMGKEIFKTLVPKGRRALKYFWDNVRSISAGFSIDPISGKPRFDLKLGEINTPELTLEEICQYLESADKPCIFAIDEFQQITRYRQANTEALLRSCVQKMNNCRFIFSGSDRHILEQMFSSYSKPFYNSAKPVYLDRIEKGDYLQFVIRHFSENEKNISEDAVSYCYDLFEGYTYYMQKTFHELFPQIPAGGKATKDSVNNTVHGILDEGAHAFGELTAQLSIAQKGLLCAIAKAGKARNVTSGSFVKSNALPSPSSVQKSLATLLDLQLISFQLSPHGKEYFVADKFMELWLKETY